MSSSRRFWQLGDPNPHLFDELEMVMGPLRATAEGVLQQRGTTVESARLLGDLLNELPRDRVASIDEREQLYKKAVDDRAQKTGTTLTPAALQGAQDAINACDFHSRQGNVVPHASDAHFPATGAASAIDTTS